MQITIYLEGDSGYIIDLPESKADIVIKITNVVSSWSSIMILQ